MRGTAWIVICVAVAAASGCGHEDGVAEPDGPPCLCDAWTEGWQSRAPTPVAIQETAVAAVGGRLYVLGGFHGDLTIADTTLVYDPDTDAWSEGPALPAAVHHANVAVGTYGLHVVGVMQGNFNPVGAVWYWDLVVNGTWEVRAPMPRARGAAVVGEIDGKIYVAGGLAGGAVDFVDEYDPAADTWTPRAPLPVPRDHACGAVIAGILYVAGGRDAGPTTPSARVFAYNPTTDEWTEKAPMLTARGGTACGVVDGNLIVVGGEGNSAAPSGVFPQVESYYPPRDSWEPLEPMPNPRHGMGAGVIGNTLYVPGGADMMAFGAVATHDAFRP